MKSWCLTIALGLGSSAAFATLTDAEVLRCLDIADTPARLVCYDQVARALRDSKVAPAAATAAPIVAAPAADPAALNFGRPAVVKDPTLSMLESRVDGRIDGWQPGSLIHLANGQVWQVGDSKSAFATLDSPKVNIRPGLFGSFFLEVEGLTFQVRVKRVQ